MKKKGFTLVEILAVLAVAGILITGIAVSFNKAWQNNRVDACESELREMVTAFKSYITDYGNITVDSSMDYDTVINEVVSTLNSKYLPYDVEKTGVSADGKSITLKTKLKTDPWNNKYSLHIYTAQEGTVPGLIVIASSGADSKSNETEYSSENYGDDIVAIIKPN